jgi:glycosyltransferase involved in cell wall biosynthesis
LCGYWSRTYNRRIFPNKVETTSPCCQSRLCSSWSFDARMSAPDKKRAAIFSLGGVGSGNFSQGFPTIMKVLEALAKRFDITVYSLGPPNPDFEPRSYALYSPPEWLKGRYVRKLRWAALAGRFWADQRRRRCDVILSFWGYPMGTFAVALGKLAGVPSVVTILGAEAAAVPSIGYGALLEPATRRLVLETCARASALVVVSESQREILRQHGLRRQDVQVIPLGMDPDMFGFQPKAAFRPPLKILHVANLTAVKDQATLVRGFALLRRDMEAKLRIVGPDHMRGRIHRLVAELGVQDDVELTGPLPYHAIAEQHRWADMFVLTSLSEGQNTALMEAAMCGVLQVSTPVGHIKDLGEAVAVVVRLGDPADLAAKIRAIVNDPKEWQAKVARARVWAAEHDLPWTVARLTAVMNEAAGCR